MTRNKPRDIPASVEYVSSDVAVVSHPAGLTHKRALETIDRLRARGLSVLLPPSTRESLALALIEEE